MSDFWIEYEKKKPGIFHIGVEIFLRDKHGNNYIGVYHTGGIFEDKNGLDIENVTHWAEIPNI